MDTIQTKEEWSITNPFLLLLYSFVCSKAPPPDRALAGATFLSESVLATDWILKTELGQKLKEKGVCFWRDMTDREHYQVCKCTSLFPNESRNKIINLKAFF